MTKSPQSAARQARISPDQQIDRFRQMARELDCDEDEDAFRAKLRTIARQKVKDETKKKDSLRE